MKRKNNELSTWAKLHGMEYKTEKKSGRNTELSVDDERNIETALANAKARKAYGNR